VESGNRKLPPAPGPGVVSNPDPYMGGPPEPPPKLFVGKFNYFSPYG